MTGATKAPDDLSALVGSRICHDLVNPLGAIGNGVELLHMAGIGTGPELDLIEQAVQAAQGRLALYRLAFGTGRRGDSLSAARFAAITGGAFATAPLVVATTLPDLTRDMGKTLALAILCLETALPRGGRIDIAMTPDGPGLAATGMIRPLPDLWAMLTTPPDDLPAPGLVQFALLGRMLAPKGPVRRVEAADRLDLILPG